MLMPDGREGEAIDEVLDQKTFQATLESTEEGFELNSTENQGNPGKYLCLRWKAFSLNFLFFTAALYSE